MAFHNPVSQITSASSSGAISTATALPRNNDRNGFVIQNLGTNTLYVYFGAGASTSVFSIILKGSTVANDGTGGSVSQEDGMIYTGLITVAGTSPSYVTTEF